MAWIVMQEEKVRQRKVFVVLMQRTAARRDQMQAAAPAWRRVFRAETGSTFYSPPPPLLFPKRGEGGG